MRNRYTIRGQTLISILILILIPLLGFTQMNFVESSRLFGLDHSLTPATIGCGISTVDFNQDGIDDLTLGSDEGEFIRFYISTGSELELIDPLVHDKGTTKQLLWVDYDNDEDPDLFISNFNGINRLYENQGELNLVEVTEAAGLNMDEQPSYGAVWGDYNRDGWLDLYTNARVAPSDGDQSKNNRLFKNNGDGTFRDVSIQMEVNDPGKLPFCSAFVDYNNDGWPDIYIANDKLTTNTLLKNVSGQYFEDVSASSKSNYRMNAMCVNPGDINQDGWTDIYITNTPVGNRFLLNGQYINDFYVGFYEQTEEYGVGFYGNGWGSNFLDADNDGDLDLYVSGSIPGTEKISSVFYEKKTEGGFLSDPSNGFIGDTTLSYSNAIGDINNDGLMDIVVHNNKPFRFHLWMNQETNNNNWLRINLKGVASNIDAIGSKIEVYSNMSYQSFYKHCGQGFLGQNSAYVHAGLSDAEIVDSIVITWPSGHIDRFYKIAPNQSLNFYEGESTSGAISLAPGVRAFVPERTTPTVELPDQTVITVSPSPFINSLDIRTTTSIAGPVIVNLYDINGKTLQTGKFNQMPTQLSNLEHLPNGIVIMEVLHYNHSTIMKLLKL